MRFNIWEVFSLALIYCGRLLFNSASFMDKMKPVVVWKMSFSIEKLISNSNTNLKINLKWMMLLYHETICTRKVGNKKFPHVVKPCQEVETESLLGKPRHTSQLKASKGGLIVPIGQLWNSSRVEHCPRCGCSPNLRGKHELWVTCRGVSLPDFWLHPLDMESGHSLSPWPGIYGKNKQKQLPCLACVCFK